MKVSYWRLLAAVVAVALTAGIVLLLTGKIDINPAEEQILTEKGITEHPEAEKLVVDFYFDLQEGNYDKLEQYFCGDALNMFDKYSYSSADALVASYEIVNSSFSDNSASVRVKEELIGFDGGTKTVHLTYNLTCIGSKWKVESIKYDEAELSIATSAPEIKP